MAANALERVGCHCMSVLPVAIALAGVTQAFGAPGVVDPVLLAARIDEPRAAPGEVMVIRDTWGVPHVFAQREADGFFGVGYASAEDNLHGILRAFKGALGQLAEVDGPVATELDLNSRRWQHEQNARAGYERLPRATRAWYRAYAAGVRRYMSEHPERVPDWAPDIQPWLPIAVADAIQLISVSPAWQGLGDCVRGGAPAAQPSESFVWQTLSWPETFAASNQWAIAPQRSADGVAILVADSHPPFASARIEIRIHAGEFNTSGILTSGAILPIIAHNRGVGWSFTDGGPDVSDCYEVTTEADDPLSYLIDGKRKHMTSSEIEIRVKGGEPVHRKLEYTHHNGVPSPVVARVGSKAYVVSSPYWGRGYALEQQIHAMNRAESMEEFKGALKMLGLFPENVLAADRGGHIFYVRTGRVPRRDPKGDWQRPVPGNSTAFLWKGLHEFSDLVQIENPAEGYIFNMNTSPDTNVLGGARLVAERFAPYLWNDMPGRGNERSERATELLTGAAPLTGEEFWQTAATDEKWIRTPQWQRGLRGALQTAPEAAHRLDAKARRLLGLLIDFDGFASKDSVGAAGFFVWRSTIGELAVERGFHVEALVQSVEREVALDSDSSELLLDAIAQTSHRLVEKYGSVEVPLGTLIRIGRGARTWPMGGATIRTGALTESTLRASDCGDGGGQAIQAGGACVIISGQGHPIVTEWYARVRSKSLLPFGQSDNPASPHFSDQSKLASERRLKPSFFHWDELKHAVSTARVLKTGGS